MDLGDATWTDVETADATLAALPVGSTEQHGPHAPLRTDTTAAVAVAEAAAESSDQPILVAPAIPVGVSEEHRHFPGTLWVEPDTFRSYVRDVIESLAQHGVDAVVVVNGHGGNRDALAEVCRRVTRDDIVKAVPFTWFEAVDDDAPPMGHAGARETALLRHVAPSLVAEDRVADAATNASDRWGEWVSGTNLAVDTVEFSENGVVGDPSAGDAAVGERLLGQSSRALVALFEALAER